MTDRFDLEQRIMECWNILEDLDMTTSHFIDSTQWDHIPPDVCDALMNKYFGIKELYELKFQKLWSTFETCITAREFDESKCTTDTVTVPMATSEHQLSFNYEYESTDWNNWNTFTVVNEDHDYNEQK